MANIERFEDIEAWQQARALVKSIYTITKKDPFHNDWGLKDQMQRAAVSVMSNIAEGVRKKKRQGLLSVPLYCQSFCRRVALFIIRCL
jgi:four helix bundle protein